MIGTFSLSFLSECFGRKMFLTSISNCFSSMHLSFVPHLNTGCHNEGPPVPSFMNSPVLAFPTPVVGLLLLFLTFAMVTAVEFSVFVCFLCDSLLYCFSTVDDSQNKNIQVLVDKLSFSYS